METVFEKIINRQLPAEIVYEDCDVIAIKDINPAADVHLLVISKKVIPSFHEIKKQDFAIISKMIEVSQKLAEEFNVKKGYRIVTNIGKDVGQSVFHLHFHLLGGKQFRELK